MARLNFPAMLERYGKEREDRGLKNVGSLFKKRGQAEVARRGVGDGIDLI